MFKDGNLIIDVDDMYFYITDCFEFCMERDKQYHTSLSAKKTSPPEGFTVSKSEHCQIVQSKH